MVGTNTFHSIDEYIIQFPEEVQEILKTLRKVIKDAAPEADEKISISNAYLCFIWKSGTFRCL